jgi:hypothetical protein
MTIAKVKHYAKAIVAFLGALATLLVQVVPSLPQPWQERLAIAIPFATFVTVYLVPNAAKMLDEPAPGGDPAA